MDLAGTYQDDPKRKQNCVSITSPRYRQQLYATLSVNVLSVAYGTFCGWPSASFPELMSATSAPLPSGPLNMEQLSWVVSYISLGSVFGNTLFNWSADRFGRKSALLQLTVPALMGWCLLIVAQNASYLYVGRFLQGLAGGGMYVVIPLFVAEIADKAVRGALGTQMIFACALGILIAFIGGELISYAWRPIVLLAFPIVSLVLVIRLPETPAFLMRQGRDDEAERSLRFYRNVTESDARFAGEVVDDGATGPMLKVEMEELRRTQITTRTDEQVVDDVEIGLISTGWSLFNTHHGRRAVLIGLVLCSGSQLCGLFVMLNYTDEICSSAGATMSTNQASIVMGVIQLLGTYASTMLVDRTGRKFLLIMSAIGSGIGLVALGVCIQIQQFVDILPVAFGWVPLASFGIFVFFTNCGLTSLPLLIVTEVLPERVRSTGASMCLTQLYVLGFVLQKCFPQMVHVLGMAGTIHLFAVCSLSTAVFVAMAVPETKGKSFEAIRRMMEQ